MGSIAMTVLLLAAGAGPVQDATETATELLETGARHFSEKDTAAMVSSYTSDAQITLLNQKDGQIQEQEYRGTERIRKLYTDLFANAGSVRAKNVVEYARFVGPDLLLIGGTFEPNIGEPLTLQFFQVRVKHDDGDWRIKNLQLFPIPTS